MTKIQISVKANELFSKDYIIPVSVGQVYEINVDKNQNWCDFWIKTDPDGFCNPFLLFTGRRLKGVKCFCLCGTIGLNEEHHFKIGSGLNQITINQSGNLYFFANDSINYYHNNSGSIQLVLKKIS